MAMNSRPTSIDKGNTTPCCAPCSVIPKEKTAPDPKQIFSKARLLRTPKGTCVKRESVQTETCIHTWAPLARDEIGRDVFRSPHAHQPAALTHPPGCGAIEVWSNGWGHRESTISRALATSSGRVSTHAPQASPAYEHVSALPVPSTKQGRNKEANGGTNVQLNIWGVRTQQRQQDHAQNQKIDSACSTKNATTKQATTQADANGHVDRAVNRPVAP